MIAEATAANLLMLAVGFVAGGYLGYITAWRLGRKLERHGVQLAAWDVRYNAHEPLKDQSTPKERTYPIDHTKRG